MFHHNDPKDRLYPANARLSIIHTFDYAPATQEDREELFAFLEGRRDIWLKRGLAPHGATGTTSIVTGAKLIFQVQTPRRDLAMLFKMKFGGAL